MEKDRSGFREVEHTADWELEVWGPDLPSLFEQAARGMYALSGTQLEPEPRQELFLELRAHDVEGLLVCFLTELLFLGEQDELGFDTFELQVQETRLSARLVGAHIRSKDKEIKAVTFHGMKVQETESGLSVKIVFDV